MKNDSTGFYTVVNAQGIQVGRTAEAPHMLQCGDGERVMYSDPQKPHLVDVFAESAKKAAAKAAGVAWAEREAEALEGRPRGYWRAAELDALPLVDGNRDLAAICHDAADRRWAELVEEAST